MNKQIVARPKCRDPVLGGAANRTIDNMMVGQMTTSSEPEQSRKNGHFPESYGKR